jgi:ketosteroid isomerase-like protein
MVKTSGRLACSRWTPWFLAAALIFLLSSHASGGQKNKKSKTPDPSTQPAPPAIQTPDSDQIENDIGEMLAAFQLGNVEIMHKYYSENVTFVSGDYAPPVIGWQNYVPLYQRQRAAFQAIQLNRRNTLIFTHGDVAWATYEWQFDSILNGQPYSMRGQTTLVFNKVAANWLIVHNHTSEVSTATGTPAKIASPQQSAAPPASPKQ